MMHSMIPADEAGAVAGLSACVSGCRRRGFLVAAQRAGLMTNALPG
jgi:hypothetical protein